MSVKTPQSSYPPPLLPSPLRSLVTSWFAWALLPSLIAVVSYYNSLHGELVHDDIFAIRDNNDLRPSTSILQIFQNDFWGEPMSSPTSHKSYRPLTILSFRLNYILHDLRPFGYHFVNLALHVVATLLLGVLCRCAVWCGGVEWAFVTMCLFAAHPVHTEAVSSIVGRADLLACVLFLTSLLLYWSSLTSKHSLGARTVKFAGCLATGAAAMLCKEHGVTVFGVCLLYDVCVHSRRQLAQCVAMRTLLTSELRPLTFRCTLLVLTTVTLLLTRIWLLNGQLPAFSAQDNPASFADSLTTRVLTYSYLYTFNAKLLFYPAVLCFDYQMGSIPLVESLTDIRNITTALFYLSLCCLTWRGLHDNCRVTLMGLLLIVIPFLPASNLFLRVGFVVAERILYISSAGYCILVVHGAMLLVRRFRILRPIVLLLLLLTMCALSTRTLTRNPDWATRESLLRSGLRTIPHNAKVHFNLANFLKDTNRTSEAVEHYRTAIRLWPEHAVSHNNLGTLLTDISEAESHFRAAIEHSPGHFKAMFNLGSNLVKQGRLEEAEQLFKQSLSLSPSYTDSLTGLASMLLDVGRGTEGWSYMERAVAAAPDNADVLTNAGTYLWKIGRTEEAIVSLQRAIDFNPFNSAAMVSLGRVYRGRQKNDKAEHWLKRALTIDEDPSTLHLLAAFYHNTRSLEKAAGTFQRALQLDPMKTDTLCSYGQTLLQLGRHNDVVKMATNALVRLPAVGCLHSILASAYMKLKQLDKAVEHSSQAVQFVDSASAKVEALQLHGAAMKDLGQLSEAENAYREAVSLDPDNPTTRLNYGAVLHLRRNLTAAREQYKHALRLDHSSTLAAENLRRLDRAQRKVT